MPREPSDQDRQLARQSRLVGIVLAVTAILWLGAQWVGGLAGLQGRYAFLFDFAALAAFFWALVVTYKIWRARQTN